MNSSNAQGWICLYRQIKDNYIWLEKPFDKAHAWIDLLISANHEDKKFLLGNETILVERGSLITSELKLMDRWGWSKTKVRSFLDLLQKENMIQKNSDKKKTTLNIVNYRVYQDIANHEKTTEKPQKDHKKTIKRHKQQYNNDNNDNNDNKYTIYGEQVIDYLNKKTGKHFSSKTKDTIKNINARFNDGYTISDLIKVIDIKYEEWHGKYNKDGKPMDDFLRPSTLFGQTNFDNYLNESGHAKVKKPGGVQNNYSQRDYDIEDLEKKLLGRE